MNKERTLEQRVLVLAPCVADAALSRSLLTEAGMTCHVCTDLSELCRTFESGAGAILLTDEILGASDSNSLVETLQRQPDWSDVPVLLLSASGGDSPGAVEAMELLGNVTILERPVRMTTLVSVLRTALKTRRRQYELRNRLEELRASEERLASELEATRRLHALSGRLLSAEDLTTALDDVLDNAMATCGADFGNIQLFNSQTEALEIVVQRGFREDFLDYFGMVRVEESSACAQAMQSGERIIIENVELDSTFKPHRRIAAAAGFRAVQSTPLRAHGSIVGMLSTHFRAPHRISERDQRLLDLYARHATDLIERFKYAQALKEADRRKDEFLAMLGHELRNPLGVINTVVQLLRVDGFPDPKLEEYRRTIELEVKHMARLLDDLLDVSRIARGVIRLKKELCDLAAILRQVVENHRPIFQEAGLALAAELPDKPFWVIGDPTRLAQIVGNLLYNAIKFTDRGGRVTVRLSQESSGNGALITVRDTGIGMESESLGRIFEPFVQVDSSVDRSRAGLGLGLALVKGLVNLHGGEVWAASDGPGQGSEFSICLPLTTEPSIVEFKEPVGFTTRLRRVLIIEDNLAAAQNLQTFLVKLGHTVQIALSGWDGIEAAHRFQPEIVVCDIGLPGLDGYAVGKALRQASKLQGAYLIAVSGYGQQGNQQRALAAGFDKYLTKPVDLSELERLVGGSVSEERTSTG